MNEKEKTPETKPQGDIAVLTGAIFELAAAIRALSWPELHTDRVMDQLADRLERHAHDTNGASRTSSWQSVCGGTRKFLHELDMISFQGKLDQIHDLLIFNNPILNRIRLPTGPARYSPDLIL